MADTFWDEIAVPYQDEDEQFDFSNLVSVSQHFAKATASTAYLGKQAEDLNAQVGDLDLQIQDAERALAQFRRELLAKHYKRITKSASSEVQEAFVYMIAEEEDKLNELKAREQAVFHLARKQALKNQQLEKLKYRLKLLETSLNWGKQHLDFEKLVFRTTNYGT